MNQRERIINADTCLLILEAGRDKSGNDELTVHCVQ